MSACRLMDTFISSPDWNRTIFTDSVQLFSDDILLDAQATAAARQQPPAQESRTDQRFLEDLFLELQESLKSTQKELSAILAQSPTLNDPASLPSSSLKLNPVILDSLESATTRLLQLMNTFEQSYHQEISPHVQGYHRSRNPGGTNERDTVPGLGEAARNMNRTQDTLLSIMDSIRDFQESVSSLSDPSSTTREEIIQARKDLLRGSDDSNVETMLERLLVMSATLEIALERTRTHKTTTTRAQA
ncbi:hypothetical protein BGX31_006007 [Mortierella sp. GBA43]|nr:hypothetical protein BGX31_006007 [Mortierella sp. GBA43]